MLAHGTAPLCNPGQQAEITSNLVRALPRAFKFSGLLPKEILRCTANGEELSRILAESLKTLSDKHEGYTAPDWDHLPYNPHNWKVLTHLPNGSWRWDRERVELWSGPVSECATVGSVLDSVADLPVLNATVAEGIALHRYRVGSDWINKTVIFPGTIFLTDNEDGRMVMSIFCGGGTGATPTMLMASDRWHSNMAVGLLKQHDD